MDLIDDDTPDVNGAGAVRGNAPEFSVSDLSGAIKRVIEGSFDHVRVRGEVGRVSRPRSGHLYMDLKDDRAVLSAICWKGAAAKLEVQPEEGMEVIVTGRLTTFAGQSRYQLIIESMAPAGMGALMAMLEKRKAALAAEGLFAPERKRPIPYLPRVVGVVTSPSGAVIRDILHRLAERFPMDVLVWPVAVQGKASAGEVAAAIRGFNALGPGGPLPRPNVLIVARGGGSVEDLWGFNEEVVVRAAAESTIPLISAVGHETDTTLIDFASDRRAPTPTAAAEMAAPVRGELIATLASLEERRARALARGMEERARRIRDLARALPKPDEILAERRQRLDTGAERLPLALSRATGTKRLRLAEIRFGPETLKGRMREARGTLAHRGQRLGAGLAFMARDARRRFADRAARHVAQPARLLRRGAEERHRLDALGTRLARVGPAGAGDARRELQRLQRLLESLGHKGVLARGYALVRGGGGVLTDASAVSTGQALEIEFRDGRVAAVAAGKVGPVGGAGAGRKTKDRKDNQEELDL